MVDKRTLMFAIIGTLVWAVLISSLAAYFYVQNTTYTRQIAENQQSLNKMSSSYDESMSKYNALQTEYSTLYFTYSNNQDVNFTSLIVSFSELMNNLKGNYSSILADQKDLNETCYRLEEAYQKSNVTREGFEGLLNEYYELFNLLAIRELNMTVSETVTLTVNICIDYGNKTEEWHNETKVSAGYSLFQLTQSVATIDDYDYSPLMKPGHILLKSINGEKESYNFEEGYSEGYSWIWYYWDENKQNWNWGPVGCDAWVLKDGGIYKWSFEYWCWSP